MNNLYYQAPTDEQFNEVKAKAIEIWDTYDNTYGYRDEKVDRIKDLKNIDDNVMYIIAMFDGDNQAKLAGMLSDETRQQISLRMIAGGNPPQFNPFLI